MFSGWRGILIVAFAVCGVAVLANYQTVLRAVTLATYDRPYAAYAQTDTTETEVTASQHADGRDAHLISAFFGLDNGLPDRISDQAVCKGAGGADGMPVIFSHEVAPDTVDPGDFKVVTASGAIGEVTCLSLDPANDPGELRTVLLTGEYGSADDAPVTVEIVGNVLSLDGTVNFKGATVDVVPLETGPTLVWAEIVPAEAWELGKKATRLPWGGGDRCPVGTQQVVRVAWNGGVTKPGGEPADAIEGALYEITILRGETEMNMTAFTLADLNDGDNNHLLCLDTRDPVQSVSFPAGYLTDPREDLNPDTSIPLLAE